MTAKDWEEIAAVVKDAFDSLDESCDPVAFSVLGRLMIQFEVRAKDARDDEQAKIRAEDAALRALGIIRE